MDTVTDLSELAPRVVFDRAEIDRLRLFQINRYFESGILVELPKMLAPDPSIELSTYFLGSTTTTMRFRPLLG